MVCVSWLLMWFEVISRLKVNLEKDWLIPIGRVEFAGSLPSSRGIDWGNFHVPTWFFPWELL